MFDFLVKEFPDHQRCIGRLITNGFIVKSGYSNILLSVLFLLLTFFSNATNYYVSNSGNDSNDGTEAKPWATINKVNSTLFRPGDQILFKRGDTWREFLVVSSSGSFGNPIVFGAYGAGDNPIITGANIVTGFSNGGNNIWDATVTSVPRVVLKSKVLQKNAGGRSAINEEGEWYWIGNTLSIYATSNPSGIVEAGRRTVAMDTGSNSFLTFSGITFECSNGRDLPLIYTSHTKENSVKFYDCTMQYSAGWGIYLGGNGDGAVSDGMIDGCVIRFNWQNGIFVQYDATSYIINNSEIYSNGLDPATANHGIWGSLGGFTLSNCDIYDNGRGLTQGPAHGIYNYISSGTVTIENCIVHNQPNGSGIRLRGSAIVRNNAIYDNAHAGINIDQNASAGETYTIIGNLIYRNHDNAVILGGALTGNINLTMYHNTVYHDGSGALLEIIISLNNLTLKNNIFYVTSNYLMSIHTTPTTRDIHYNIYYRSDARKYLWRMGRGYPTTFAGWQALGHDSNGYYSDPDLMDPTNNFQLKSGSPAIDAGVDVDLVEDFEGNPIVGLPDIGAFEYQYKTNVQTTEYINICEGSSYEGWTSTGKYHRVLKAFSGADSIVTTNLMVNPVYHDTVDITILEGESYKGWLESGQYERILTSLSGCDSIITTNLKKEQLQTQSINLNEGWNIFSSRLIPPYTNLEDVLEYLILHNQLVEVQDQNGKTFQLDGNGWNNNIGAMQQTEGYKIKVNTSSVLQIEGYSLKLPLNIKLKKGLNIISFPYNGSVNAMEVIKPLIDAEILAKVQDEQGNSIEYWGNLTGWINGIGNFNSGEGYLVQVIDDFILPIQEVFEKPAIEFESEPETQYFKVDYDGNGVSHMNINIIGLSETNLQEGDEIAAFDGDICVGATKLNKTNINNNVISIHTSAKDKDTYNGFKEGNTIELRFWDAVKNEEVTYHLKTIKGELTYQKQGSVFIQLIKKKDELNDFRSGFDMYPNPANDKVTMRFSQVPEKEISILFSNINGKILLNHEVKSHVENLDIQYYPPGIYLIKIASGGIYISKKLIINR